MYVCMYIATYDILVCADLWCLLAYKFKVKLSGHLTSTPGSHNRHHVTHKSIRIGSFTAITVYCFFVFFITTDIFEVVWNYIRIYDALKMYDILK